MMIMIKTKMMIASDNKKEEEEQRQSLFNFVAVGDWDCNGETKDTRRKI